jgi:hypothetical protein
MNNSTRLLATTIITITFIIISIGCDTNKVTGAGVAAKPVTSGVLPVNTSDISWCYEVVYDTGLQLQAVTVSICMPDTDAWIEPSWFVYYAYSHDTILVVIMRDRQGVDIAGSKYKIELVY